MIKFILTKKSLIYKDIYHKNNNFLFVGFITEFDRAFIVEFIKKYNLF